MKRSLPPASRWAGAIETSPRSPATGDSAASHRAPAGGPGASAPSARKRARSSRCFHCGREGEVTGEGGTEGFSVSTSPWEPCEAFPWAVAGSGATLPRQDGDGFPRHRGQCPGRVFKSEEESAPRTRRPSLVTRSQFAWRRPGCGPTCHPGLATHTDCSLSQPPPPLPGEPPPGTPTPHSP